MTADRGANLHLVKIVKATIIMKQNSVCGAQVLNAETTVNELCVSLANVWLRNNTVAGSQIQLNVPSPASGTIGSLPNLTSRVMLCT